MSVQIKLYHLPKSENISDIENMEAAIENTKDACVDLYKVYHDIAMVLSNSLDPYSPKHQDNCKIIFGNKIDVQIGRRQCVGFVPYDEISAINKWIISEKLNDENLFFQKYQSLNIEVKNELAEMYSPSKEEIDKAYIKPLIEFYKIAEENENSVVICAE